MGEVEGRHLAGRQADQVDALAVSRVVVGPVGRDDDPLAVRVGAPAARVSCGWVGDRVGRVGGRLGWQVSVEVKNREREFKPCSTLC